MSQANNLPNVSVGVVLDLLETICEGFESIGAIWGISAFGHFGPFWAQMAQMMVFDLLTGVSQVIYQVNLLTNFSVGVVFTYLRPFEKVLRPLELFGKFGILVTFEQN